MNRGQVPPRTAAKGFTLVEVVTSMLLAVIILLSAGCFITEGTSLTKRIEQNQKASILADTLLTEVRSVLKNADNIGSADGASLTFNDSISGEKAVLAADNEGHLYIKAGEDSSFLLNEADYMGLKARLSGMKVEEDGPGKQLKGTLYISAEERLIKTLNFTLNPMLS